VLTAHHPKDGAPVSDWTTQTADAIENTVALVRDKAVVPIQHIGRVVVFGLLGAFFLGAAAVVGAIGTFRALASAPWLDQHIWADHLAVGGLFGIGGLLLWSRRTARAR
jgi:hypothetical protein